MVPGTENGHLSFFGAWHRVLLETNRQKIYTDKVIYVYCRLYMLRKGVRPLPFFAAGQMPVKITVKTTIRNGQDQETYELITFGRYIRKTSSVFLRYDEVMEEGSIQTTVKIAEGEGSILRNGAVKMRLPFQKNKQLTGSYETPYGTLEMGTKTSRIHHEFNENIRQGEIDILYDLNMQGSHAGTYHLLISFEEE